MYLSNYEAKYFGMDPSGLILNFDDRREFPNRATEHIHAPIHVVNASKVDDNKYSEVIGF